MAMTQINRLATSKAESHSDSDESIRVLCKKRVSTSVIPNRTHQGKKTHKHHRNQRYCILCKKAGIPGRKRILHRSEKYFSKRSEQHSIKDGLGDIFNMAGAVNQYKKS